MCRIDDGEPVTVLLDKDRKARKQHRCDECHRTIERGEVYEEQRYAMEGGLYVHKTCDRCQIPRAWLTANCGGWIYGQVREEIAEHVTEYPYLAEPLRALADGMGRHWRADDGALMPMPTQAPRINVEDRHA